MLRSSNLLKLRAQNSGQEIWREKSVRLASENLSYLNQRVGFSVLRQSRPIPANFDLGQTLAQRVNQVRNFRNLTVRDLARLVRWPATRIDDIESGIETWLSTTERQILAKALGIEPNLLREVERRATVSPDIYNENAANNVYEQLVADILGGARTLTCPNCGDKLKCSIQDGLDLDGNHIQFAKAFCQKCPYFLR